MTDNLRIKKSKTIMFSEFHIHLWLLTMQLNHQQFGWRFRCVTLVVANVLMCKIGGVPFKSLRKYDDSHGVIRVISSWAWDCIKGSITNWRKVALSYEYWIIGRGGSSISRVWPTLGTKSQGNFLSFSCESPNLIKVQYFLECASEFMLRE